MCSVVRTLSSDMALYCVLFSVLMCRLILYVFSTSTPLLPGFIFNPAHVRPAVSVSSHLHHGHSHPGRGGRFFSSFDPFPPVFLQVPPVSAVFYAVFLAQFWCIVCRIAAIDGHTDCGPYGPGFFICRARPVSCRVASSQDTWRGGRGRGRDGTRGGV